MKEKDLKENELIEKEEEKEEIVEETEKEKIENKVNAQIQKKQEKENRPSRIAQYLKEEHKWFNYVLLFISVFVLMLGILILVGTLVVKENIWFIGEHPTLYGIIIVVISALGTLYSLYPFYRPCFPEFKKITWLKGKKFIADIVRVFLFIIIFTLLFLLYDSFISQVLGYIFN